MPTYTLRVDGKYDLARWTEGWSLDLDFSYWNLGVVLYGKFPIVVNRWLKTYRGRKLVWTNKVPEGAKERREEMSTKRCCHP